MSDDFSNAPPSVSELRADRAGDAALWTTRDMLIALLRDIDAGKIDPVQCVVVYRETPPEGGNLMGYWTAGAPDLNNRTGSLLGMLDQAATLIRRKWLNL